jgi:O-antigen/teichoic acid export membrane protein
VATGIAALVSLVGNLLLIPRYGATGAAWVNACSYAVLAGTAYVLSQRVYPVRHEYGRLARLVAAGAVAWLAARAWPVTVSPLAGFLLRGLTVLVAYPILLAILGFYQRREIDVLARLVRARRSGGDADAVPIAAGDEPVESAGAILDVPLVQDELPPRR